MVLKGFFDESVRLKASDPITVAGYVFNPTEYTQFSRRWKRVRALAGGVRSLHMTDLFAGERDFDGMSILKRADVFAEAVKVINDHMT